MINSDAAILGGAGVGLVGLSFALAAGLCALARRWAPRRGRLDVPGGHKGHKRPTPLGGGVAIWLATMVVLGLGMLAVAFGRGSLPEALAVHVGGLWATAGELALILGLATIIMIMGLVDDRVMLGWRLRLGIQV